MILGIIGIGLWLWPTRAATASGPGSNLTADDGTTALTADDGTTNLTDGS